MSEPSGLGEGERCGVLHRIFLDGKLMAQALTQHQCIPLGRFAATFHQADIGQLKT